MTINYRGFTIELECDGTWSVYHDALHYVSGNNIRVTDAEEAINALLDPPALPQPSRASHYS